MIEWAIDKLFRKRCERRQLNQTFKHELYMGRPMSGPGMECFSRTEEVSLAQDEYALIKHCIWLSLLARISLFFARNPSLLSETGNFLREKSLRGCNLYTSTVPSPAKPKPLGATTWRFYSYYLPRPCSRPSRSYSLLPATSSPRTLEAFFYCSLATQSDAAKNLSEPSHVMNISNYLNEVENAMQVRSEKIEHHRNIDMSPDEEKQLGAVTIYLRAWVKTVTSR